MLQLCFSCSHRHFYILKTKFSSSSVQLALTVILFAFPSLVITVESFRTGELSAVKVVKLEAGDNFAIIQQEIMMIRDCVHPNIIAYHGSYLRRDRLWIVMEYCSGGSLQDIYHSKFFFFRNFFFCCWECVYGLCRFQLIFRLLMLRKSMNDRKSFWRWFEMWTNWFLAWHAFILHGILLQLFFCCIIMLFSIFHPFQWLVPYQNCKSHLFVARRLKVYNICILREEYIVTWKEPTYC